MQDNTSKTPALSRTWQATISHVVYGENWGSDTYTVTLTRQHVGGPLAATINGEAADVARAVRILESAFSVEVLAETLAPTHAPSIGKPAACELHKELGRLKYRNHYATASEAHTVRSYAYGQWGMTA